MAEFSGHVAVVPGGAGGIGSAVATAFGAAGAQVVVADLARERAEEVAAALPGGPHSAVAVDVGDPDSVAAAVQLAVAEHGRVDFLAYCAGNNVKAPTLELTLDDWNSALASHLTGAFLFSQAVAQVLVRQGQGGRLVFVSSVGAWAPIPERGAYSPAKAALNSFAAMLAVEWAAHDITANTVCPGVAETAMTTLVYQRDPQLRASRRKRMPIKREVRPSEIADLIVYLCGESAAYINGVAIPIDGGFLNSGFMPEPAD
jgi:NAD(P)-dependent dehydrogenase (short-subunit alcohol dehydrogenase family)